MDFTKKEMDTLGLTNTICTSLSILGAVLVIGHHFIIRKPQTIVSRILVFMAFSDLFTSSFKAIPIETVAKDDALCQTQAFFVQFGNLSHILWSLVLSLYLFLLFYKRWTMMQLIKIQKYDWMMCILLPFIVALIPLMFVNFEPKVYSATKLWCWIPKKYYYIQLIVHFVPLWLAFLYTLFNYSMIAKRIWTYRYSDFDKMTAYSKYSFSRAATLCLLLFLITWIPSTCNRVYSMIYDTESFGLNMYQGIFSGLRGFNYFLLYAFFQITVLIKKKNNPDGVTMADNGFMGSNLSKDDATALNMFNNRVNRRADTDTDSLQIFVSDNSNPRQADIVYSSNEDPAFGNSLSSVSTIGKTVVEAVKKPYN
ncbi:hypothetical protein K502DRAFT_365044 [Neoconidiobolus thromboides FSU 785]|nr:hypothetical protein K502DRAFT_365044 [Neoconidiobolus thromboides FSU 785]